MDRKQLLQNYRECYGRKRHAPTLRVRDKPRGRVGTRMVALLLVLGAGAACVAFTGVTITSKANATRIDIPAAHVDLPPRQLNTVAGNPDCVVDERAQRDRDSISLLTVRHADLTSIGCPGAEDFKSVCLKKDRTWMIILYILGVFYMFIGIAIVCDEFFVPALESFVDICGISMDVAGATFMAAGGSMPELATSFISTFNDDNVGFAAIVGSAVFNVLFVIAVCAIASKETLTLSGWPLARDATFYLIALFTIVGVFSNSSNPATITWWEATILLMLYVSYCFFMKNNARIEKKLREMMGSSKVAPEKDEDDSGSGPVTPSDGRKTENRKGFRSLRKGIVKILTEQTCVDETLGIAAVMSLMGDLDQTFTKLDQDEDGFLSPDEMMAALKSLGLAKKMDRTNVETAMRRLTGTANGMVNKESFKRWYIASESRIEYEVENVFRKFDLDNSGTIDVSEIKNLMVELGHNGVSDKEAEEIIEEILIAARDPPDGPKEDDDDDDNPAEPLRITDAKGQTVNLEEFQAWYLKSIFGETHHEMHQKEADDIEDDSFNLEPPWGKDKTFSNWFWYLFSYPLCAAMYCTVPDVRKHKRDEENKKKEDAKKTYKKDEENKKSGGDTRRKLLNISIIEFLISLVWIAAFANCLYEWIVVISFTIGIPPEVSAVTVLAAGTSIPDLLSSWIVARNGEGDMAVSSSIGSNIFDVTVGLPLPWLMYNIICAHKAPVKVEASNIGFSIIVLIIMLMCVVATIVLMKWRMTKAMGYVMLVLYFAFVAQDLMQQLPKGNPVFTVNF